MYLDLVILLNFIVDFLLLIGASRLTGYPLSVLRCCIASAAGGIYAGVCLLPNFAFLGTTLWRIVFLTLMAVIAFGINQTALRRGIVFVFLSMALGGIAVGMKGNGFVTLIFASLGLVLLCLIGFRSKIGSQQFAAVELIARGKKYRLTALRDTGNTLKDPLTGEPVLIVGADVAQKVMDLSVEQLSDPISTISSRCIPGLRLIPYRAVGQSSGMLLAHSFDEVRIDGIPVGKLVAFAPDMIRSDGVYQALTGGVL